MYILIIYIYINLLSLYHTAINNINTTARSKPGRDTNLDIGCGTSPADHCMCVCVTPNKFVFRKGNIEQQDIYEILSP